MSTWSDLVAWFRHSMHKSDSPVHDGAATEPSGRLMRWPVSKRDRQIAGLQAGYTEMLDLVRGLREHLERQQQVQEKMVQVLDRLPDSIDGLKNVGKAAEQQVEVLSLLRNQIEAGTRHDQQLVDSMKQFNQTLSVMDETSRHSGRAVNQLVEKAAESERTLREAMERSERRFLVALGFFAAIAVLSVGVVLWVTWREGRAPTTLPVETPAPALSTTPEPTPPAAEMPPPSVVETPPPASVTPPADEPPAKKSKESRRARKQRALEGLP